ncbi:hypothetical protein [Acetobacter sp. KSO5]|uniref:hypothetical protein n=1 Tax=Acetobacter sp. KSO5 TaxID=3373674 RepID=UPI00376EF027
MSNNAQFKNAKYSFSFLLNISSIDSLSAQLVSPDLSLYCNNVDDSDNNYYFESLHLNDCQKGKELNDRMAALQNLFYGALLTYHSMECPRPVIQNAYEYSDDTRQDAIGIQFSNEGDAEVLPFSEDYINSKNDFNFLEFNEKNPICSAIYLARHDETVRSMLKKLGYDGICFISLYALTDWMKSCGWKTTDIYQHAGWDKDKLSNFTNTANNTYASGMESRHGYKGNKKSENFVPMPLEEAAEGILKAFRALIQERLALSKNKKTKDQ